MEELEAYHTLFEPAFRRPEQAEWSKVYRSGLLGDRPRKNTGRIALALGENVRSLQHFIGQSPWSTEPVLEIHQGLVGETLGEADGAVLIDESGMVKQGKHSVGVARQYCGSVGKVANSGSVPVCAWAILALTSASMVIDCGPELLSRNHTLTCRFGGTRNGRSKIQLRPFTVSLTRNCYG